MSKEIRSKTLAIFVVLAMVLSTMMVFNTLNFSPVRKASATIGVDEWQNNSDGGAILNMSTENVYYGNTVTLKFNGSAISQNNFLYKPNYRTKYDNTVPGYVYYVNWTRVGQISSSDNEPTLQVNLDRAGMWLVMPIDAPDAGAYSQTTLNMTNLTYYNGSAWNDITGWFWVNSTSWDITLSRDTVTYDANESIEITVKYSNGGTVTDEMWIDIWRLSDDADSFNNGSAYLVYHKEVNADDTGVWNISGAFMYTLTHEHGAGVYQVVAYRDIDPSHDMSKDIYGWPGSGSGLGYNLTFGNESIWSKFNEMILQCDGSRGSTNRSYSYNTTGPFDPPEYIAWTNFTVSSDTPSISIDNTTQYYNFSCWVTGNVTLTVKDSNGNYLNVTNVTLFNSTSNLHNWKYIPFKYINISGVNEGANITIGPNLSESYGWGHGQDGYQWARAGKKVYVVVKVNTTDDETPEWNGTVSFDVKSAPSLAIIFNDDDGSLSSNNKDGVIPRVPDKSELPIWINFTVIEGTEDNYLDNGANI